MFCKFTQYLHRSFTNTMFQHTEGMNYHLGAQRGYLVCSKSHSKS